MNKQPLSKKQIKEAANAHALAILGNEEFEKNLTAKQSIVEDFTTAAEWAIKELLQLHDSPGDPAHRLITTERLTQLVRGYDTGHDDTYNQDGRLAQAAALLAAENTEISMETSELPWPWPLGGYPDKRGKLDPVRRLVIAGALIAAEIDRIVRKAKKESEVNHA